MNFSVINQDDIDRLLHRLEHIERILSSVLNLLPTTKKWLTGPEVMEMLGIGRTTLQKYRDQGMIGFSKIGRKIKYKVQDVEKLMDGNYLEGFGK